MKRILASLLAAFAATAAMADALDTTLFSMKSQMTIPGYAGSTTLANFPVLVRLSAGSPSGFAYADVTNGDIRFADANGNSLPFEIEKWDSSGESHVWVSVPSLSGQATTITMYYGAITGKLPPVDSTGVWSLAGYQNVHHFSDASGYMDIESSANNLTVTRQGANTVDAAGVLGSSLATGSSGYNGLSIAVDNSWAWGAGGTVTFSAWGKRTSDTSNRYLFGTTGAFGYANASTFTVNVNGTTASGTISSVGDWTLYTLVVDGSTLSLYINGTLAESKSGSLPAASAALYWGSNGSSRWKGSIDEARLRNVADTPDWIQACCDTMTNANFVVAAAVEANATTAPTFTNGTTGTPLDATKFASRIPLTISGYDGSDAIENLPVLVRLGSISAQGFDVSALASDGSNFRFADALGNNLPFEIDTWDATSGKNAWVTVPYVEGTGTTIYLYFDTSATLAANDSAAVWTNACYKNVMHYQSTMDAAGCHDSTGINTGITTASTTLGTDKGKVGDGADSSNSSSTGFRFTLGDAAWGKGDPITFSTWAYTTDGSRSLFGDYDATGLYSIYVNNSGQLLVCNRPSAFTVGSAGTKSLALANDSVAKWCYFTFVCDGAVTKVYANGAYEGMVATPLPVMSAFAWGYANAGRYKGYCDESRIHAVAETADFVAASYKAMTDASFVVAGAVEPAVTSYTPQILSAEPTLNSIEVKTRLTAFEAGASSVSLTLLYGTSADALTSEFSLGSITAPGSLTRTLSGLGFSTTYYLQVKAVDNFDNEARSEVVEVATGADTRMDTSPFAYKSAATVGGYAGSTTLANFPVLVRLAANSPVGFNYEDCAADGSDIRFTDVNGIPIPHEIDTWDPTGTSLIWVQIPKLSGSATELTMYYGAADPASLSSVTSADVWTNANYNAVWHFSGSAKESANGLTDSGSSGNPTYTATTFGVGTCFKTTGNTTLGYNVDAKWTTLGTGGTLTLSTWAKFDGSSANYNRMLSCMSDWAKPAGWELTIQNASVDQITVGSSNKSQFQYTASGVGPGSGNVYLSVVYNADGNAQLYVNGALAYSKTLNNVVTPTEKLWIGSLNGTGNFWNGSLDEIRIHRDAESADWVKACYDTMASASFVTMDDVTAVGGVQPLAIRSNGATLSGTTATITGRLANLGTGATSADVTLYYGTSANVEGGTAVGPASYNDKADLSNTLLGLTPAATYYYAYKAVNNASTPETAWTATNSFVVEASTKLSGASASAVNCSVTVSGAVSVWGVGTTTAELLFGSSASDLAVVQTTDVLSAEPAGGTIAFDPLTRPVGTYSYAIRTITSYNGVVWTNETAVGSVTLSDAASYTWKGGTGAWTDAAMWTTSDSGAAGVPSAASTVVFGDAESDVTLAADVTVAGLTVFSVGTHAFRSDKTMTTRKLTGPVAMSGTGGGTLVLDSLKFESQISDLAGLKQLVIENMGWAEAASSAATDIVLVNGGTFYGGTTYSSSSQRTYGKLKLVGGPNRISFSQYTQYGIRFASFEAVPGSGAPVVSIRESANTGDRPLVAFDDATGIELVGGDASLADATSKIPVCPNFMLNDTDTLHGKGACTIMDGEVRKIPQSTMLTTLAGATETDNVCLSSDCTLDADVTVNALLFTGANIDLGGHTVTVRSGVFREGDGGMFNKLIQNGVVKLGRPDALGDGVNNGDARNKVDFAVDGNDDPETCMLAHNAQQMGWNCYATYANFVGTFATPPKQDYSISSSMCGTNAVVEMRGGAIRAGDHYAKVLFRGLSGVGSINFQNKWKCGLWLGDLASAEDQADFALQEGRVVVGHGGIVKPGCVDYDGGRRGCFSIPYVTPQGTLPKLSALEFRDGARLKVTLRPDGTCSWLDASQTQSAGAFLDVTLAGDLVLEEAGHCRVGNGPWVVLKTGKPATGFFANAKRSGTGLTGYKVDYNVALPDGTYAVTVSKRNLGTVIVIK